MQVPVIAVARQAHPDVVDPIKCAVAERPNGARKHGQAMLRYFVLVIALLAVVLLMAIALYYTQGNAVTIVHVSSLAPGPNLRA